jgi:Tfp pilus assembly protein PilO
LRAAEAEVQARALSALEATVASSKGDRMKLESYILKDEAIIDLLSLIERTALEQGVVLKTNSLTVAPIDDIFEELQVTVEITGSFDGVLRMVRILEHIPEQSSIPRVMLTKSGDEIGLWQASVDVRVTKFKKV